MTYSLLHKSIYTTNIEIKKKKKQREIEKNKAFARINVCFIKIGCAAIQYVYCLEPLLCSLIFCMLMQNSIMVNYVHCIHKLCNDVSLFTLEIKTNKWI